MKLLIVFLIMSLWYRTNKEGWWWRKRRRRKCNRKKKIYEQKTQERAVAQAELNNYKNQATYTDTNFNIRVFRHFKTDLDILNSNINEYMALTGNIQTTLSKTIIAQKNNKILVDKLKVETDGLKECSINKEMTDADYNVLL